MNKKGRLSLWKERVVMWWVVIFYKQQNNGGNDGEAKAWDIWNNILTMFNPMDVGKKIPMDFKLP